MVRSNFVSGVGLAALFESLDSRQLFSSTTVGADPTFAANGHLVAKFYGHEEAATTVVTLKDGRALVGGWANDGKNTRHEVLALFKVDGTLDSSFDSDGKMVVSAGIARHLGQITDLQLLKDGSVLVVGTSSVAHMSTSGTFDAKFGRNGYTSASGQMLVMRDGTFRSVSLDADDVLRVTNYSATGKMTSAYSHAVESDNAMLLATTTFEAVAYHNGTVRQFTPTAQADTTFAASGTLNAVPAFNKWAKTHGGWGFDESEPTLRVPDDYNVSDIRPTRNGYVLVGGTKLISASTGVPASSTKYERYTAVYSYVGAIGGKVAVQAGPLAGSNLKVADFNPQTTGDQPFAGTFTLPTGKQVFYLPEPNDNSGFATAMAASPAGDGKYYVVGQSFDPTTPNHLDNFMGFYVTRSAAIA